MKDRITVTFSLNLADAAQWQKVDGAKWLRKKLRGMRSIGVEKKLRDKAMRRNASVGGVSGRGTGGTLRPATAATRSGCSSWTSFASTRAGSASASLFPSSTSPSRRSPIT